MRSIIFAVAVGIGVVSVATPLLAEDESQSEIQFAPDDEELGSKSAPKPLVGPPAAAAQSGGQDADGTPIVIPGAQLPPPKAPKNKIFGRYRLRISGARPTFSEQLKFYHQLYGNEHWYPQIQGDWFAWDWYATLGLSFRMGYYLAEGHAAQSTRAKPDIAEADFGGDGAAVQKDRAGPTTLTLVPLQMLLAAQFTPFSQKWLVLDGFAGFEYLYWQEVRTQPKSAQAGLRPAPRLSRPYFGADVIAATKASEDTSDGYTNKGYKRSIVVGWGLNIAVNALDERSVASMRASMGLGNVYVTPFMEMVRQLDKGVTFSRQIFGVGFTFESIR